MYLRMREGFKHFNWIEMKKISKADALELFEEAKKSLERNTPPKFYVRVNEKYWKKMVKEFPWLEQYLK